MREKLIGRLRYLVRVKVGDEVKTMWLPDSRLRTDPPQAELKGDWHPAEVVRAKKALSRKTINQRMEHIKRVFAWAVSEELVPTAVHESLLRVAGLRRGHAGTRDTPKVKPVPDEDVQSTLPHLLPQVAAMVRLQQLMGARPTEVCLMRGRNVMDRDRPVWKYVIDPNEVSREEEPAGRLANLHKCAHHEAPDGSAAVKVLPIGPRAQQIIKEWLRDDPDEFLFQPGEARSGR